MPRSHQNLVCRPIPAHLGYFEIGCTPRWTLSWIGWRRPQVSRLERFIAEKRKNGPELFLWNRIVYGHRLDVSVGGRWEEPSRPGTVRRPHDGCRSVPPG